MTKMVSVFHSTEFQSEGNLRSPIRVARGSRRVAKAARAGHYVLSRRVELNAIDVLSEVLPPLSRHRERQTMPWNCWEFRRDGRGETYDGYVCCLKDRDVSKVIRKSFY